jgi:hypothetical protein
MRSDPTLAQADLQLHFGPAYFVENGFADYDGLALTLSPVLISRRSRGWANGRRQTLSLDRALRSGDLVPRVE